MFAARLEGFDALEQELREALDVAGVQAMSETNLLVAQEARAKHAYTNRTRDLEGSTTPDRVWGRITRNNLRGDVIADTPYGEFLEEERYALSRKYAFLLPAYKRAEGRAEFIFDVALNEAAMDVLR